MKDLSGKVGKSQMAKVSCVMRRASWNTFSGPGTVIILSYMLINLILIMILKKCIISFFRCGSEILRNLLKVMELSGEQVPEKENMSILLFPLNLKLQSTQKTTWLRRVVV